MPIIRGGSLKTLGELCHFLSSSRAPSRSGPFNNTAHLTPFRHCLQAACTFGHDLGRLHAGRHISHCLSLHYSSEVVIEDIRGKRRLDLFVNA